MQKQAFRGVLILCFAAACTLPDGFGDSGDDDMPMTTAMPAETSDAGTTADAESSTTLEAPSTADPATTDAADSGSEEAGTSSTSVDPSTTGELSCDQIDLDAVMPPDRRLGIGYLFLQTGTDLDPGLASRSLCLGDCLGIQDIDVRSLCLALVNDDACECEVIGDYTLRNVCQGNCEAIGMDADMRNFCLGGEACELLQDHDQRSYCMGDCALIPNDPNFRYFCEGACNLIN